MYVITGASGNTGSVITKTLLAKGQKVRALGRSLDHLQHLAVAGAESFVCDVTDKQKLVEAFGDARAVYLMIPPNSTSEDFRAYQDHITETIATALEAVGVKYAVTLSSIGADKSEGTGPVVGLHNLEQRLNRIAGLNVLHLRAAYFMENALAQIAAIKWMGATVGTLLPDLKLPIIATRDIGAAAAEALLGLEFTGQQTRELQGQRDLTMSEVTEIIGAAINKPDLRYMQVPEDQFRAALLQTEMSLSVADLLIDMSGALNSGHMAALEERSASNTTPTTFETFVAEEFVLRYQGKTASA